MTSAALILGLAASGQTATWLADVVEWDNTTITWKLSLAMEADAPYVAFSGAVFDTLNTFGADEGHIVSWEVLNQLDEVTGDLTTTDGDSLFGTNAAQFSFFGPFSEDNPIEVLQFTWETDGFFVSPLGESVVYETSTDLALLWVGDDQNSAESLNITDGVTEVSFSWAVTPSPGGLTVLGVAGAWVYRRRR